MASRHIDAAPGRPVSISLPDLDEPGATLTDDMRRLFTWCAARSDSRRSYDFAQLSSGESRLVEIALQRYGASGEASASMQCIAERHGLTRERVRQIIDAFMPKLGSLPSRVRSVERLREAIAPLVPCTVAQLDETLTPLLGRGLSIKGAERFAREVLGQSIVTLTSASGGYAARHDRMALPQNAPDETWVRTIRETALFMIRFAGAAQVNVVAGAAAETLGTGVAPARCRLLA